MYAFERILFLSDFLRVQDNTFQQRTNLELLHVLLHRPLRDLAYETRDVFHHPKIIEWSERIFSHYGRPRDPVGWASLYDVDPDPVFEAILIELIGESLVISFELPPSIKRALTRIGKVYIDLRLHPFRFLPDLILGMHSNDAEIDRRLQEWSLDQGFIDLQIALARMRHHTRSVDLPIPKGSVFLGQMRQDASMIEDGYFLDAHAVLQKLEQANLRVRYFKPHPYDEWSELRDALVNRHGAVVIRHNIYDLLSTSGFEYITVSSSSAFEARTFGNVATFLSLNIDPDLSGGLYKLILQDYAQRSFWAHVLGHTDSKIRSDWPFVPNTLRNSWGWSWGHQNT